MFERFDESARRTLFFARYEASEFGSMAIETEHMLMGLIREARGIVAGVLTPDVRAAMQNDIRRRVQTREKIATSVEIPFSAETKRALQYASEEADGLKHSHIGNEHLLLGLMRESDTVAGSVLQAQGFTLPEVRASMMRLAGEPASPGETVRDEVPRATDEEVHQRIEHIKVLVEDLADEEQTSANRQFQIRQIVAALDDLARRLRTKN
jgi:ATP-dependent Clp protease ATP-binding subunit ClpC